MNMVISGAFKAPTCATKKQVAKNENSKRLRETIQEDNAVY